MKFTSTKRKLWITVFTTQEQILSPNVRHCKNTPIKCVNLFKVNWRLARCFSPILSTMHKKRSFLLRISSINVTKFCRKHLIKQSLTGNFIFLCSATAWYERGKMGRRHWRKGCFYFLKMLANLTPSLSLSEFFNTLSFPVLFGTAIYCHFSKKIESWIVVFIQELSKILEVFGHVAFIEISQIVYFQKTRS